MYLRWLTRAKPKDWVWWVPWAEYCYNTSWHSATKTTPFAAVYGRAPPTLLSYVAGTTDLIEVDETLRARDQSYRQHSVERRPTHKLSPQYFGPYWVLERIGSVAYRLELPSGCKVHLVFHISLFKRKIEDNTENTLWWDHKRSHASPGIGRCKGACDTGSRSRKQIMSSLSQRSVKLLEKELPIIRAAIRKITRKLDTGEDWGIDDRMNAFTAVYNLCNNYQDNDIRYMLNFLYNIYKTALKERIKQKALPSLENKQGMLFLRELVRIWSDYFNYSKSLIAIFRPVERKGHFYVKPSSLTQISILHFSDMIWAKFFTRIDGVLLDKPLVHACHLHHALMSSFDTATTIVIDGRRSLKPLTLRSVASPMISLLIAVIADGVPRSSLVEHLNRHALTIVINSGTFDEDCPSNADSNWSPRDLYIFFNEVEHKSDYERLQTARQGWEKKAMECILKPE
ncbi:hypothetical protein L484_008556 [Morus notabilis]|uniref:Reverse transcriptase n=1 Tax=Morus notabilis TaxID=981085 RepID=W9R4E0_9ROSA|nr:hypothetical protein L484_008556 [Morus notabilis]